MTGRPWGRWVVWSAVLAALTLGMLSFRTQLDKAHVTLVFLLVVLLGTAAGGRAFGLTLAAASFLLFDLLFLPPYGTLVVANPLDWLVLFAFLLVSGVVAQMLHGLKNQAETARLRAEEVDRLAQTGAEALKVPRAETAIEIVAETIRAALGLTRCRIHEVTRDPAEGADPLAIWAGQNGRAAIRLQDATTHLTDSPEFPIAIDDAQALFVPLRARNHTVGVLELASEETISLSAAQRRFLTALSYYAALAVERARLEREVGHVEVLREADKVKNALLASVSHDLRTPLTTIKALAHDIGAVDDRAIVIEQEADRLNRLVANLLDLSRLQAGGLPLQIEINAVDDVVGALYERVSGLLSGRRLDLDLADGGTMLAGRFDFAHTLRILVNLVENAHKYAPPGTPIRLEVTRSGSQLEFTVSDQGPGVSPADRAHIFEPFYRGSRALPDTGGAGLGLAIARQLATAQGGDLEYRPDRAPGASFSLTLPAVDLPTPPAAL